MNGIQINVTGNIAKVTEKPKYITAGTVGLPVQFTFDSQWDGLAKVAVFQAGHATKTAGLVNGATVVPWEVLRIPGVWLSIGVYGTNADGSVALPTVWANVRVIQQSANPNGEPSSDGTAAKRIYEAAENAAGRSEEYARSAGFAAERAVAAAVAAEEAAAEICYFGYRYTDAEKVIDLNEEKTVKLYLFPTAEGYDAVVAGEGAIMDFAAPQTEARNSTGLYDITVTENRDYAQYVPKISRLHIEMGVQYIGDYFMCGAYNLKHLSFADSAQIKHLGTQAFAKTQISSVYDFSGLEDAVLSDAFWCCPKLEGLTFNSKVNSIAARAFQFCLALQYVDGLEGVTEIGYGAFHICPKLNSLDIVPGVVKLGPYAFISTPNEVYVGKSAEVTSDSDTLLQSVWNEGSADLCFTQKTWGDQLEVIQEVTGERASFPVPESDQQKTNQYWQWGVIPMVYQGSWYTGGHPASGCCGLFCLFHIYNILHPNAQYDTFYNFIKREIEPKKITVDDDLVKALDCTNGNILKTNRPGVYDAGKEVSATDLPMALDDETLTWGEIGTAPWGICKVLGWGMDEKLLDGTDGTGAEIKETILAELAAGRPVMMEIVFAIDTGHGMHIVTVIGYNKETDKLRILDSTWGFPSDVVPMVYELPFEALISPDAASAIWTFNFGEEDSMKVINGSDLITAIRHGFRVESGTVEISGQVTDSATGTVEIVIPCTSGAKMVIFEADEQAYTDAMADANKYYTISASFNFAEKLTGAEDASQFKCGYALLNAKGTLAFSGAEATNDNECTMNLYNLVDGTYRWKAYYWDE